MDKRKNQRNKLWRRKKQSCLFKKRMLRLAAWGDIIINADGTANCNPHWFEFAREHWAKVYKTTGTPCSCLMCRGEEYDRLAYKKETRRIIREAED